MVVNFRESLSYCAFCSFVCVAKLFYKALLNRLSLDSITRKEPFTKK